MTRRPQNIGLRASRLARPGFRGDPKSRLQLPIRFGRGFTLVELMVALYLSTLLSVTAFGIYKYHSANFLVEDANLGMRRALGDAMDRVSRDIRMAGNGLNLSNPVVQKYQAWTPSRPYELQGRTGINSTPGWYAHGSELMAPGIRAITGFDGGKLHADSVTLFNSDPELPIPVGYIQNVSGDQIILSKSVRPGTAAPGDILAVVRNGAGFLFQASGISDDSLTFHGSGRFSRPGAGFPLANPGGAAIFNLRDASLVTYWLDEDASQLKAAFHDSGRGLYDTAKDKSMIIADGIEDFQIFYYFENDAVDLALAAFNPDISPDRLDSAPVRAVAVALTAISSRGQGKPRWRRPALFNRNAGTKLDNQPRSTQTAMIRLRNL